VKFSFGRNLYEILAAARRLHFDISLKTNALLVTKGRAAQLREFGVRRVQISVYSDIPAVHDAVTKVGDRCSALWRRFPFCSSTDCK